MRTGCLGGGVRTLHTLSSFRVCVCLSVCLRVVYFVFLLGSTHSAQALASWFLGDLLGTDPRPLLCPWRVQPSLRLLRISVETVGSVKGGPPGLPCYPSPSGVLTGALSGRPG